MVKDILKFAILAAVTAFVVWLLVTGSLSAEGAQAPAASTTNTLATTGTLQPQYMLQWIHVIDAVQESQEALRGSILAQARVLANPTCSDDDRSTATRRLIRAQCNIEALDGLLYLLSQPDVLLIDPEARNYGLWVRNPLR